MSLILIADARAWAEQTKMGAATQTLNVDLLSQIESEVLATLSSSVDTTTWTSDTNTPPLVKTVIARLYISWLIDKHYSEDEDLNAYAGRLAAGAHALLAGIVSGDVEIPGVVNSLGSGQPSFYPNDASSSQRATYDDPSLGPAKFSMGSIF